MYEEATKLNARQQVALEVLAYHASSTIEETVEFMVRSNLDHIIVSILIHLSEHPSAKRRNIQHLQVLKASIAFFQL